MRFLCLTLFLFLSCPVWAVSESQIAKSVEKAPEVKSNADLPKLVEHLTHGLKKEEDKAYALLSWIVKNIDFDEYKMKMVTEQASSKYFRKEVPSGGDILKTRLGACEDIANLYKQMLEKANLKVVTIDGCVGEIDRKKEKCKDGSFPHSWNAVWIDDQWELVDPTWAITGKQVSVMSDVTRKKMYERELKKRERVTSHIYESRKNRSVNKKWFMANPKVMEEDHQPNDKKWLLTKTKDRKNKDL